MKNLLTLALGLIAVISIAGPPTPVPCWTFDEFSNCPSLDCPQSYYYTGTCLITYCMQYDNCGHSGNYAYKVRQKVRDRGYYLDNGLMYPCKAGLVSDGPTAYCCNCDGSREPIP
jgi:hypothetical protein